MTTVRIQNRQKRLQVNEAAFRRMIEEIFKDLSIEGAEISFVFCDNEWIAKLNQQYLCRSGPTNVISFPLTDEDLPELQQGNPVLGDVVINTDRAHSDAEEAGTDPLSELAFLTVHGICHLVGYDHEGSQAHRAAEMEEKENSLHVKYSSILLQEKATHDKENG